LGLGGWEIGVVLEGKSSLAQSAPFWSTGQDAGLPLGVVGSRGSSVWLMVWFSRPVIIPPIWTTGSDEGPVRGNL
jgi:hypothetical protein